MPPTQPPTRLPSQDRNAGFELPRSDLASSLAKDIVVKMGQTEGKNAWKTRKDAMEAVQAQVKKVDYLVKAGGQVLDLLRALKERLSDSQSNLKPLAAGIIADIIYSLDAASSVKYVKVAGFALVSAAMNDNKKTMRDAVFAALERTLRNSANPDSVNGAVLNGYLGPLTQAIKEGNSKSVGLAEVLSFFSKNAAGFAKFDPSTSSTKHVQLEQSLCIELLNCLCSAKADVRSEVRAREFRGDYVRKPDLRRSTCGAGTSLRDAFAANAEVTSNATITNIRLTTLVAGGAAPYPPAKERCGYA